MNRAAAEELFTACEQILSGLNAAEAAISKVEAEERSSLLKALGMTVGEALQLRAKATLQYPDLESPPTLGAPDTVLNAEETLVVEELTAQEVESIDAALVAECVARPRKVARVVGFAMKALRSQLERVPSGYYAQRVAVLVDSGKLEADGNLEYMRFSEVWLARGVTNAA